MMKGPAKKRTTKDSGALLLRGGRVVLPDGLADGGGVVIEGGRIVRVVAEGGRMRERSARLMDLSGLWLYPGFIDVHIHGAVGVDAMEASADDLARVSRFLASRGVTSWLPTLVPAPEEDYRRAVRAIAGLMRRQRGESTSRSQRAGSVGARALGVHYEGPFVNAAQCGALRTEYFRVFRGPSSLAGLATLDLERAVHMTTLAPEIEGGAELVAELNRRAWVVSIGHTRADIPALERAREAGARHLTHFFNAMPQLHHRQPGPVGWGLTRDDVTCDLVADGIHCAPLTLLLALRCKTSERLSLISDAVSPAGLGDGEYHIWGETIVVESGRTRNERGQIAGSVITMFDAARRMLSLGVAPHEVARMASLNPARLLRLDAERGSVEPGKRADLVAFDDEGRVHLTLIGGEVAFDGQSV